MKTATFYLAHDPDAGLWPVSDCKSRNLFEEMIRGELDAVLSRPRYGRRMSSTETGVSRGALPEIGMAAGRIR